MKDASPQPVHLADYRPPAHLVDRVELTFRLAPSTTRVRSRIAFRPAPGAPRADLALDGEGLALISAAIDGTPLGRAEMLTSDAGLTVAADRLPAGPFVWEAEVEIDPAANTALEGLYMSGGIYCTQCEAQGFRKITYYPDRPDVMAPFSVRIEADAPVLLSNGNPGVRGEGFAEWHDPWPKPSYLFALVAGDLVACRDSFTTRSGREVALAIWVRAGDEDKTAYAMDALKRAMRWDERVYGREYDLEVFNIVAVDDFNMGAMENKGLNIFNSALVLASPDTATDQNYARIESVIAHEYFHNWTGNRVTCRDWFQLCLKEGLTVFRDQQFSGDERSAAIQRIGDVQTLRARQFREDAGPLAHPVRPQSFIEINNFYTATVYEKGAELIGMLRRLVGGDAYARALALYFERHDGAAATVEDWLAAFEEATGRDLGQFMRWYDQAGTPRLSVRESFEAGSYTLRLTQETPPTPGQPQKAPQIIPVAVGLLDPGGEEAVPTTMLELTEAEQSFRFDGLGARPVPSILRGFSAPVIVVRESSNAERAFLLAHDTDPFNRWEAGRTLAKDVLVRMIRTGEAPPESFLSAMAALSRDAGLDPAFRAMALGLPGQDDIAQSLSDAGQVADPMAIWRALRRLSQTLAGHLSGELAELYAAMRVAGPYTPDADAAGRRALQQTALSLLSWRDEGARAEAQFAAADNMTQVQGALACLLRIERGTLELGAFYDRWRHDRLVIDKWFMLQSSLAHPDRAAEITARLTGHPDFDWKNPNRFRATLGGLTANPAGFHHASGAGYRLLADWLLRLDPVNPQTAARMSTAFETWRRFDIDRQEQIRGELCRIAAAPELSRDLEEMVGRMLGD